MHQQARLGWQVGWAVDIPINEQLIFSTGIDFFAKGWERDLEVVYPTATKVTGYDQTRIGYFTCPLTLKYNFENGFFSFAGGYLGIGGSGSREYNYELDWAQFPNRFEGEENINSVYAAEADGTGYRDDILNAFDYGLVIGGGYRLGSFALTAQADLGLKNMTVQTVDTSFDKADYLMTNRTFSISLTYFWKGYD